MKIAVAGIGYVGLSVACLLAKNNEVWSVDILPERVEAINSGKSPIADKEIEEFLKTEARSNLKGTTTPDECYRSADYVVIATPTNYDVKKNYFDTSSIESVLDQLEELGSRACVVIKSTVPVGYTESIANEYPNLNILFSPEFLREGHALYDNLHPSRIIVGIPFHNENLKPLAEKFASLLKEGSLDTEVETLTIGSTEAEAIKLFANTYLALRVSFFNELDTYAEARGLSTGEIIKGVGLDPRIGSHYNNPSFGYGGYCLPKDSKQLLANFADTPQEIIQAIVKSNSTRKDYITAQIVSRNPKRVGIYRLAMKKGSDNYRQSAILGIMERLGEANVEMVLYEPTIKDKEFLGAAVVNDFETFKDMCDLIVCNRFDEKLADVADKVYTRDLWQRDE